MAARGLAVVLPACQQPLAVRRQRNRRRRAAGAAERHRQRPRRGAVPQLQGRLAATGDEAAAVAAEGDAVDRLPMPGDGARQGRAAAGVPALQAAVLVAGGDALAVGAEGHHFGQPVLAAQRAQLQGATGAVPDAHLAVVAGGGQALAVGTEVGGAKAAPDRHRRAQRLARQQVPALQPVADADRAADRVVVELGRNQLARVGAEVQRGDRCSGADQPAQRQPVDQRAQQRGVHGAAGCQAMRGHDLQQRALVTLGAAAGQHRLSVGDQQQRHRPAQFGARLLGAAHRVARGQGQADAQQQQRHHHATHQPAPAHAGAGAAWRQGQPVDQGRTRDAVADTGGRFVEPDAVAEVQPGMDVGVERRILQSAVDIDRDDRPAGVAAAVFLDLGAHPARRRERAAVAHHHQRLRSVQRVAQRVAQRATGRGFVLAEEDREVALAQPARQVRSVALGAARRWPQRERDEQVIAEQPCRKAALRPCTPWHGTGVRAGRRRQRRWGDHRSGSRACRRVCGPPGPGLRTKSTSAPAAAAWPAHS